MFKFISAAATAVALSVAPAYAHEGEHPLRCEQVEVPADAECHENGEDHPTCIIEKEGQGSAVAQPVRVECLPDTGTPVLPLALAGALVVGAGYVVLRGIEDSV